MNEQYIKKDNYRAQYYSDEAKTVLHREDGPAVEWHKGGYKEWRINGKRHREGAPAVEYANGDTAWYLNGDLHREDGPAIEDADGHKSWYIDGDQLTEKEFQQELLDNWTLESTLAKIKLDHKA